MLREVLIACVYWSHSQAVRFQEFLTELLNRKQSSTCSPIILIHVEDQRRASIFLLIAQSDIDHVSYLTRFLNVSALTVPIGSF
jgi:hypothetical protein